MGIVVGHVAQGLGFLLVGLWHLFNHAKLHAQRPNSFNSSPWFPSPFFARHLELYLIMAATSTFISTELFLGQTSHQPLDPDGTIPYNHLHNFEHSTISFSFFAYAALAVVFDRVLRPPAREALTQSLAALAFAQELLLFHLHSTDHVGVEGRYHALLQLVVFVSVVTTLMGIRYPGSFLTGFVRSVSVAFQGVWLVVLGVMIWTPSLVPKGCALYREEGRLVTRCDSQGALDRAKSLANLQFCWVSWGMAILAVVFYLVVVKLYGGGGGGGEAANRRYEAANEEDDDDVEEYYWMKTRNELETKRFLQMGIMSSTVSVSKDLER
ncbi:hypothetical protein H6P81_004369 [Aristolochia fimbriata]|uniref:Uncharacterized protein n=1 Tax=Aristolochia fimbriata TaxID=158543 RepID=A0AAV7FG94_ARIFI|nr:hypothetical protein H6P81_004369 [Aristolochia fimbriata]